TKVNGVCQCPVNTTLSQTVTRTGDGKATVTTSCVHDCTVAGQTKVNGVCQCPVNTTLSQTVTRTGDGKATLTTSCIPAGQPAGCGPNQFRGDDGRCHDQTGTQTACGKNQFRGDDGKCQNRPASRCGAN